MEAKAPELGKAWRSAPRTRLLVTVLFLSLSLPFLLGGNALFGNPPSEGEVPPIEWVRAHFWKNFHLGDFLLEGVLRCGSRRYPFLLTTHDRELLYRFASADLSLRIRVDRDRTIIEKKAKGDAQWVPVAGSDRSGHILGTDLTYEDLSLDFIRWKRVHPLGTDSIKTLSAWVFEAEPEVSPSQYAKVRFWISREYFALLRADGYNDRKQPIRRLEVNAVTRLGDYYIIKEMQISRLFPDRNLSMSRTYLEITGGETALPARS
jgi:hypothetical protein